MTVEREHSLHAQRVARAETGGLCAELDQAVPEPDRVPGLDVDLVAERLAGVAGLGDAGEMPLEGQGVEAVAHELGDGRAAGEHGHDLAALGALHGDRCPVGGDVGDRAVIFLELAAQVHQILLRVGRVHDQQETLLLEAVEVGVVHGIAVLVGDDAVLRLVELERQDVAREHVLQEGHAVGAADEEPPHVGDVENAAEMTGIQMLAHDPARVLDGHFPAAKIHHGRAGGHGRHRAGCVSVRSWIYLLYLEC